MLDAPDNKPSLFKNGLTPVQQVACAWPLILVFVGGAIGGACGGGAWALNMSIMKGSLSAPTRYALTVLVGLGSIVLFLVIVLALTVMFPDLFGDR